MTRDDIICMAREANIIDFRDENDDEHVKQMVDMLEHVVALASSAEREACIAAIQAQIDHAHINELRLVPRFGKRLGEIAVRADDLEAVLEGIRTRGQQ